MDRRGQNLTGQLKWRLLIARQLLLFERIWASTSPVFLVVGIFIALTFWGVWDHLNPYVHVVALVAVVAGMLYGLRHFVDTFSFPQVIDAAARLERESRVSHRPLRSIAADPVLKEDGPAPSEIFWAQHVEQQQKSLNRIALFWPSLNLSKGDPYSLRALVILLVLSGYMMGGVNPFQHFKTAFIPDLKGPVQIVEMDLWAVPPEYTGLAPQLIVQDQGQSVQEVDEGKIKTLRVPQGSSLIGRLSGGDNSPPRLTNGGERYAFERTERNNFQINIEKVEAGRWSLTKDGEKLTSWDMDIIPDLAPIIRILTLPDVTDRSALQLVVLAEDDYGLLELNGHIVREGKEGEIKLSLPFAVGSKTIESKSYHDLTAHPWAGLSVELFVTGKDETGQLGKSKIVKLILPEREFRHPVARALVAERKHLMENPKDNRIDVVGALDVISSLPEAISNDIGAMLMVSVARGILLFEEGDSSIDDAAELLWQAALKFENGNLTLAEQALREAQKKLMEALNSGAADAEIQKLIEELKQAMSAFLNELAKSQQAQQSGENPGEKMATQDLNNILDQIDQFAQSGAREQARDLLSQLQDILENLQAAGSAPSNSQSGAQQTLNELDKLLSEQQSLLDQTMRSSPRSGGVQTPEGLKQSLESLAKQQEALRQMLGDIMGDMGLNGKIPGALGKAERAMNSARGALEGADGQAAQQSQKQAMEQLQRGIEGLAQQMMQAGSGQGKGQLGRSQNRDPLGRPVPENGSGGREGADLKIFGKTYLSTTRQVLDELRRRLLDPSRPELEKKYLKRLMERFR